MIIRRSCYCVRWRSCVGIRRDSGRSDPDMVPVALNPSSSGYDSSHVRARKHHQWPPGPSGGQRRNIYHLKDRGPQSAPYPHCSHNADSARHSYPTRRCDSRFSSTPASSARWQHHSTSSGVPDRPAQCLLQGEGSTAAALTAPIDRRISYLPEYPPGPTVQCSTDISLLDSSWTFIPLVKQPSPECSGSCWTTAPMAKHTGR